MSRAFSLRRRQLALLAAGSAVSSLASGGERSLADLLLLDARVVRFGAPPAQGLAIRDGRIVELGDEATLRGLRGPDTRVIRLAGRTVIPGLIDSHIHAIRAGLTFGTEVDWSGARSIGEALGRLREAAQRQPSGQWLVVAGGWTESQFVERRRPTQAEVARAVPGALVYIQRLYSAVLFSPGAFEALGVLQDPELASRLRVETDAEGKPTGWYAGDPRTVSDVYDRLPQPDRAAQLAGTRSFFRHLNSLGLTGVIDPGGYNMPLEAYEPVQALAQDEGLSLRVAWSLCAPRRDQELADFRQWLADQPVRAGEGLLQFNGLGENVVWGMYNNDSPTEAARDRMRTVLDWAAARRLGVTFHWNNERSVDHLLRLLEAVAGRHDLRSLRWSIAHLNDASPESLRRMQALGVGWLVQDALYYRGDEVQADQIVPGVGWPRVDLALSLGVPVGMGTDAHRVMSCNPFVALQWLLDGRTVGGRPMRPPGARALDRLEALRCYTQGSAWFARAETGRGALEPGFLADLAVLDGDYLAGPVERIGALRSVLTLVGGRVVFGAGEYAALEQGPQPPARA